MNKEKLKVQLEIMKEVDPNANLSVLAMCHILEALLEEDKEEVKVKEQPQHKPTEENLGYCIDSDGYIFKSASYSIYSKFYENNNWFATETEAIKELAKRQAISRVKEYIAENNLNIELKMRPEFYGNIIKINKMKGDCKEDLETIYK